MHNRAEWLCIPPLRTQRRPCHTYDETDHGGHEGGFCALISSWKWGCIVRKWTIPTNIHTVRKPRSKTRSDSRCTLKPMKRLWVITNADENAKVRCVPVGLLLCALRFPVSSNPIRTKFLSTEKYLHRAWGKNQDQDSMITLPFC